MPFGRIVVPPDLSSYARTTDMVSALAAYAQSTILANYALLAGATFSGSISAPNLYQNTSVAGYGTGTAYSLTATPAAVSFGTTSPTITVPIAGTWAIFARMNLKYNGATFAAVRTVSLKLRRTNNTAADLDSSPSSILTGTVTALTTTLSDANLPLIVYTTANTNDSISIFASIDVVPTLGTLDISEASLVAVRL